MLIDGQPVTKKRPLPVALSDAAGTTAFTTTFGEILTGMRSDDISVQFQYGIDTAFDCVELSTGTGSSFSSEGGAGSEAVVSCGAGIGKGSIQSKDSVRYRPGHQLDCMFTMVFSAPEAGVNSRAGIFDGEDGFAFGYQGLVFGAWFREGANETFVPRSDWNGNKLDGTGDSDNYNFDPETLNIGFIDYGYLGIAPIHFWIYAGGDLGWIVVHTIDLTNSDTEVHLQNPSLPICMEVERVSGSGGSVTLSTGSWRGGAVGESDEGNSSIHPTSWTKTGFAIAAGRNHLFTLHNPLTFKGKPNHIKVELVVASFVNDSTKTVAFYGTKGATLVGDSDAGPGTGGNLRADDASVLSVTEGGTIADGTRGPAIVLLKASSERADVKGTSIFIYPGESFSLEAEPESNATGTLAAVFRLEELF